MSSICLNMVVKNKAKTVRKSLSSIAPFINYWVILDEGSTDGTQEMIREVLKDIPGELHEMGAVSSPHHQNMAIRLSKGKGDYLLLFDANQEFFYPEKKIPQLTADCYYCTNSKDSKDLLRLFLIKADLGWEWMGKALEELSSPLAKDMQTLEQGKIELCQFDFDEIREEIDLIQKQLEKDPHQGSLLFKLAKSYEKLKNEKVAIELYDKRVQLPGLADELYFCLHRSASLKGQLKWPEQLVLESFKKAIHCLPNRAEAYCYLASLMIRKENYLMVYLLARHALSLPIPKVLPYVDRSLYVYGAKILLVEGAFLLGRFEEAYSLMQELLEIPCLPMQVRKHLEKNSKLNQFEPYRKKGGK